MRTRLEIKKGAIRLVRLGPANAQRQTHRDGNTAPVSRGVWAFPYGHNDAFFYCHKWSALLPKRLQSKAIMEETNPDARAALCEERDAAMKKIQARVRLTDWWHTGPFYSRIRRPGNPVANWHLWENASDWAKLAGKQIWTYNRWNSNGPLVKNSYSKDHFEIFAPMTAQKLPPFV